MNRSYQDVTGYFAFSTSDNFKLTGRGEPKPVTAIGVAGEFLSDAWSAAGVGAFLYGR